MCGTQRPDEDMPLALIYRHQEETMRHGANLRGGAQYAQQSDPHASASSPRSSSSPRRGGRNRSDTSDYSSSRLTTACTTTPFSHAQASSTTTSSPSAVDLEILQLGMRADSADDGSDSDNGFLPGSGMPPPPYELDREMMGMLASNWNLNEQQQQQQQQHELPLRLWDVEPSLFSSNPALATPQDPHGAATAAAAMGLHAVMSDVAMLQLLGMSFPGESVPLPMHQRPHVLTRAAAPASIMTPSAFDVSFPDAPVNGFSMPLQPGDAAFGGPTAAPTMTPYQSAMAGIPTAFAPMPPSVSNQQLESPVMYPPQSIKMDAMNDSSLVTPLDALEDNQASHDDMKTCVAKQYAYAGPSSSNSSATSSSGHSTATSSPLGLSATLTGAFVPGPTPAQRQQSAEKRSGTKPKRIRRLCTVSGCGKRARSQDLCIAHGGGRRCVVDSCEKSSQGGNLCIKHGGGKRCRFPGCDKAAQTNALCKAHGGGPRCQFTGCTKSSQGGGFCRAHGGGKRCAAQGCNKGTQRGDFCALHGGSRYCEVEGCTRNDRGGGFCAHHGGGKRCLVAGCSRSCRRNGMCSTHLRLTGREDDGTELEAQF